MLFKLLFPTYIIWLLGAVEHAHLYSDHCICILMISCPISEPVSGGIFPKSDFDTRAAASKLATQKIDGKPYDYVTKTRVNSVFT